VTWGALKPMSWQFSSTYMDEAFAVLSTSDWLTAGKSPTGFDLAALQQDLQAIATVTTQLVKAPRAKNNAQKKKR
jgi:hypothetical protein